MSVSKLILPLFLMAGAVSASGAEGWTLGPATAKQQWPWSRLVDVTFLVSGPGTSAMFGLVVSNGAHEVCRKTALQLEQDGALVDGQGRVTWDPMDDMPGKLLTRVTFHPYVEAANDGTYLDVDLVTGAAVYRDASFAAEVNADLYKTTHLVLRRVSSTRSKAWSSKMGGAETYVRGSPTVSETSNWKAMTPHPVKLTQGFYLGVFEFTKKQWETVCGATAGYFAGDTRPVETVSYQDVRGGRWPLRGYGEVGRGSLMEKLRARTGLTFDLPTAAQWEFACRAGRTDNDEGSSEEARAWQSTWSDSPSADVDPSAGGTGLVGSLLPNAWGFYDMLGNVCEWCLDGDNVAGYDASLQIDPVGAPYVSGVNRLVKGGSWWNWRGGLKAGNQFVFAPGSRLTRLGVRVAIPSGCAIASANAAQLAQNAADAEPPLLRIGVLADTHVTHTAAEGETAASSDYLLKTAFNQFKARGVDAVILAGDIGNTGKREELLAVGNAWRAVFPDNKDDNGNPVEKIFVYGNHDVMGDASDAAYTANDRAAAWRAAFDEDYADVYMKDVKGYKFVGVHWGQEASSLPGFLAANKTELAGEKPFFHVQHPHPRNTVFGDWAWGRDSGATTAALSAFTNAVSISGHSHYPFSDGHALWQGSFTALCPGSLSYVGLPYGRENGEAQDGEVKHMPQMSAAGHHALILVVYANRIVVERWDVEHAERVDADWTIRLPVTAANMHWTFAAQQAREIPPEFPAGAEARLSYGTGTTRDGTGENQFYVNFPAATRSGDPSRVQEYHVELYTGTGENYDQLYLTKRVFAVDYFLAPDRIGKTGSCTIGSKEFPSSGNIKCAVYPVGPFGTRGRPLYTNTSYNWSY